MLILMTKIMNRIFKKISFLFRAYPLTILFCLITILLKGMMKNGRNQIIAVSSIEIASILVLSLICRKKNNYIIIQFKEIIILFFNLVIIETLLRDLDSYVQLNAETFMKIFDITCTEVLFCQVFLSEKFKNVSIFCLTLLLIVKFEINDYNLIFTIILIFCIMINFNHQKDFFVTRIKKKIKKKHFDFPFELDLLFKIDQNMKMKLKTGKLKKFLKATNETELTFISKLQKTRIEIKKEYSHLPEADAIISDLSSDIHSNKNSVYFQDFILSVTKKEDRNYFCLGKLYFQDEEESMLVFFWKKPKDIFFQIKRDFFIKEAVRLKISSENYSKSIYYIAYKLRDFLNCIENLELLKSSKYLSSKVLSQKLIKPAVISSKLIMNLVEVLLDITQMEANTFKLNNIEFDLCSLLEETANTIIFQAQRRRIKLNINFDCSLRKVQSDPNRIRQIIINLLS